MIAEKNMTLLAPYGSMKFTKLSTKVGVSAPPPGDGKTPQNILRKIRVGSMKSAVDLSNMKMYLYR